jgi:hypothetical protein
MLFMLQTAQVRKKLALPIIILLFACTLQAQTKIFKEVGEDMSTQIKTITQDNALVGYLAFTRLEKADADSFNYRLTIMDENLNDIGTVNFRQGNLDLQAVSFEQNVLCLGYVQSPLAGGESVRTRKDYKKAQDAAISSHILVQYSGFSLFYGDDLKQDLLLFDSRGDLTHEQRIEVFANHYYLRTTASDIYLLMKDDVHAPEGGYKLYLYSAKDLSTENNFDLMNGNNNWLKVLSFDNDPRTGDAFIAGCIINPKREKQFFTANDYSYTPYLGLFTLDLGNPHKDMHANCSYWSTENIPGISGDGLFVDKSFYVKYATAFRDYNGNTIFAGTALVGKGFVGAAKYKLGDGVFVRQEASGNIVLDNTIPCDETKYFGSAGILYELDKKDYYKVVNPDTKSNYMIIDDQENIYIYNVNGKKVMRTIPHKDGNLKTNVYPAKEGHMMVSEYNRKEKYTRFSIEVL